MPVYRLDCTDCSFTAVVDGEPDDVMDRVDRHVTATAGADLADHFVEFELVER